ncbi:MAG TPA: hypothetical protein VMM77_07810 [Gemmatimonadaceae bacterium]|nr:hypothetical protein [Gemmatimonadaceae bacterium]
MKKRTVVAMMVLSAAAAAARPAHAQRQTIEIRGQVPTPQIVTVRPREVAEFPAQVLVPAFYDHQFWPMILPAYQIVQRREVFGSAATDSMLAVDPIPVAVAPQMVPDLPARDTAVAPAGAPRTDVPAATRDEEIELLRRDLEARRARVDSIESARKRQLDLLEQQIRERQREQRQRIDTTAKPPGTSPAPLR